MKITFDHSDQVASNIRMFWFKPDKEIRQTAGQYIELRIPHDNKDNRGDKRWFTLSSSPTEAMVAITTKIIPECSSFKKALQDLQPGEVIDMASPMGDFVLPKDPGQAVLFVAGGIGCTPYRSMITYLKDSTESRNIGLLYAANSLEEVAFKDAFSSALGDKFTIILSNPGSNWQGLKGHVDATVILAQLQDKDNDLIYLSGPEMMVDGLHQALKDAGFNKKHIKTDRFPGYGANT